jgi:hypothetical protein
MVVCKPFLRLQTLATRLAFAKRWVKKSWDDIIVIDEKWFTEQKPGSKHIEVRDGSPVKRSQAFIESKAETNTQLTKLMYLVAVSKHGRIGMWKLDWKAHNPKSRGVGSQYLA